jgi:hypothetical protein
LVQLFEGGSGCRPRNKGLLSSDDPRVNLDKIGMDISELVRRIEGRQAFLKTGTGGEGIRQDLLRVCERGCPGGHSGIASDKLLTQLNSERIEPLRVFGQREAATTTSHKRQAQTTGNQPATQWGQLDQTRRGGTSHTNLPAAIVPYTSTPDHEVHM